MEINWILLISVLMIVSTKADRSWLSVDDLENHIRLEDLREFIHVYNTSTTTSSPVDPDYASFEDATTGLPVPNSVDCFGLGSLTRQLPWIFNMKPDSSDGVNTHFYFSSRTKPEKVQVYPGEQFGLQWVDFKTSRRTVMIYHGFMSHSNASWVNDMTRALLAWADVNVIAVDWSKGGDTWKYWRAVANTRRVGSDVTRFMRQLMAASGAKIKDFHFIGHSLGAHISSYVSYHIGGVSRITGLDPAQPCFLTTDHTERLDKTDADFVDVIHTNGRLLKKIGFGLPDPTGHADFYPNGGMKQPGCYNSSNSIWARLIPASFSRLKQAICSHGRAYLLFTESLMNNNCSFRAHRWNLTYEGVNASLKALCSKDGSCAEMGIKAVGGEGLPRASGPYFVLTTEKEPYCPTDYEVRHPPIDLLRDLRQGFIMTQLKKVLPSTTAAYADPEGRAIDNDVTTTTEKGWFGRWFGR